MLNARKIIVVLPAYNAESTLEQTYQDIPLDIVDDVLIVDDKSADRTVPWQRSWVYKPSCITATMVMVGIRRPVIGRH